MKELVFCLVSILLTQITALSQGYIQLENGKKVAYEKFKITPKTFQVTRIINGKKVKENILIDSIKSYEEVVTTYYKKPNPIEGTSRKFDFVKREASGKINLYIRAETTYTAGQYGGVTSSTFLYLEKDDRYEYIFIPGSIIKNKKKGLETLKSFIKDDAELLARVESDDFKLKSENIIRLIKEYNLK